MKTINKLFSKIIKELHLEQLFWECWQEAPRKCKDFKVFFQNIIFLMLFRAFCFHSTIHKELGLTSQARACYRILRNEYYDFSKVVNRLAIRELRSHIVANNQGSPSYRSRNKIFIVIDETILRKTTDGFEEVKKFPGKGNEHCFVAINILLVINGKEYNLPLSQQIIPATLQDGTKIDATVKMLEQILLPLKEEGHRLKDITLLGDREYLCDKINKVCVSNEVTFECMLKRNTKLMDDTGMEQQAKEWIATEKKNGFRGFKQSAQLSTWCRKHNHPDFLYKAKILDTRVLGRVKVVMVYPLKTKFSDKEIKIYVSTDTRKSSPNIIRDFREIRWIIERPFHYSLKTDLEMERNYQGRSFIGIKNNYALTCLGYFVIVKWKKQNRKSSWTFGEVKRYLSKYFASLNYNYSINCNGKNKKKALCEFAKFNSAI